MFWGDSTFLFAKEDSLKLVAFDGTFQPITHLIRDFVTMANTGNNIYVLDLQDNRKKMNLNEFAKNLLFLTF